MGSEETMRYIDSILNSSVFWGILTLILLLFGSKMEGVVRTIAFALSWFAGSYAFYRWWSANTAQDLRLIASFLLIYTGMLSGIVLLVSFLADPLRRTSRPITGEPVGQGTIVASVSLLDVGASPTQELIANPPDWVKPTSQIHLIFQDSRVLTTEMKDQVTQDLSAFREYLLRLGVPVSDEFPPIGVSNGPGSAQTRVAGSLPTYRSSATITQGWFVNRRAVTAQYANYAIDEALRRRLAQHPSVSLLQDVMAASVSSRYYNWSFWDYKPIKEIGYWSSQLWEIRSKFGKAFTDRLLGFTLKSILDTPEDGADPNFDTYFYRKIQQGDSVIDNNPKRMSTIAEIIEKSGIDVTTPKAYFDFSANAVKRHDGSYVATNKSDVPANYGQFRMYFAPDVELLLEPKGSLRNSMTTLRSARLIPFDSISAHAPFKMNFEFRPISEPSPDMKFFLLHFDYNCETCGTDNYSHDLKFTLNLFDFND